MYKYQICVRPRTKKKIKMSEETDASREERVLRRAHELCEKRLGPDHEKTLLCLEALCERIRRQSYSYPTPTPPDDNHNVGKKSELEALYHRLLAAHERVHGITHAATVSCLHALSDLMVENNNELPRAEDLYRRKLEQIESVRNRDYTGNERDEGSGITQINEVDDRKRPDDDVTFDVVNAILTRLIDLCTRQGKWSEVEALYRRQLQEYEIIGHQNATFVDNDNHGGRAAQNACLKRFAQMLMQQYRLPEAEVLFRQALDVDEKTLGGGHLTTLDWAHDVETQKCPCVFIHVLFFVFRSDHFTTHLCKPWKNPLRPDLLYD